ncbi:glycoside hydrolase family 5 protein [Pinibacter soli]|uniref:Cellulase family glycosylhydrolase n=1 Tax=Pinibacter soli TaxID=3044211 RepID=A0ABT6REE1_9BACT|nr:cellulase family glycosylhydrolase [Pinibacter soli]MDI3320943.1 cellulase family glycosylhydrolase [Pinibacter soli]
MKKICTLFFYIAIFTSLAQAQSKFVTVQGKEIIGKDGKPFLIKGTNLGNWLVPEGYMFKFKNTNSPAMIHAAIAQVIGPEEAVAFWKKFLQNYVTQKDIHFLKSIGVNSIRVPFNYRLFTKEDYLGVNDDTRGFELLDKVIKWCKAEDLYVILDMHCAPGGQTGDNIDDSFGYPFLFQSEKYKKQTIDIWKKIAARYSKETTVMGYDLLNEPVAHYFNADSLSQYVEPFYKDLVKEIRKVDKNHIMFLGGAQWNTNFKIFGQPFDSKLVYTFHKYGDQPDFGSVKRFIEFRDQFSVPIYAGETGENNDEWVMKFRKVLEENNIGWHFWPYKKMDSPKNIASVNKPALYDSLITYAETPRNSYKDIRNAAPNRKAIKQALNDYLENCKFENCVINEGYVKALGFEVPKK